LTPWIAADYTYLIYSVTHSLGVLAGDDTLILHFITCCGATVLFLTLGSVRLAASIGAKELLGQLQPSVLKENAVERLLADAQTLGAMEIVAGLVFIANLFSICCSKARAKRERRGVCRMMEDERVLVAILCFVFVSASH